MACRFDDGALALTEVDGAYVHGASGMANAVPAAGSTRHTSLSRKRHAASPLPDPTSFTRVLGKSFSVGIGVLYYLGNSSEIFGFHKKVM